MKKKACIFLNGTSATSKKTPITRIQRWLHPLMFNQHNIITELHRNCREANTLNLDGPGTDIFRENHHRLSDTLQGVVTTLAGALSGNRGKNSVWNNLETIKTFLIDQSKDLGTMDELQLDVFGWSRGGYTALLVKNALSELRKEGKIRKDIKISLHIYAIDPVPGGPDDRFHLPKISPFNEIETTTHIYYSDTGNLNIFDKAKTYWTQWLDHFHADSKKNQSAQDMQGKNGFNIPFFSSIDHEAEKYLFKANHEEVAGKSRHIDGTLGQYVGDIIIADILGDSSANGTEFRKQWQRDTLEQGEQAIAEYINLKPKPANNRKYLDPHNGHRFFGKDQQDVKNLVDVGASNNDENLLTRRRHQRIDAIVKQMGEILRQQNGKSTLLSQLNTLILPGLTKVELLTLYKKTQDAYTDKTSPLRELCRERHWLRLHSFGKTYSYQEALNIMKKILNARIFSDTRKTININEQAWLDKQWNKRWLF